MAKKAKRRTSRKTHDVGVAVPQGTAVKVHDLSSLSDKEIEEVLKKAKTSKVGFVILNAPFKVRPVESTS
jgi:hypothetical protein